MSKFKDVPADELDESVKKRFTYKDCEGDTLTVQASRRGGGDERSWVIVGAEQQDEVAYIAVELEDLEELISRLCEVAVAARLDAGERGMR